MKVLLLAGEESGVLYAERIRAELLARHPDSEIRGYGDSGFKVADLAVIGFVQVLRRIFYFLRVKRTMERVIDAWRPDVVCTVDYPGMNLKLAAYAKARGIRAVHVVCPQVWAWKKGRIPKIEASLDRLCCFFPFEPALFRPGFAAFVGHPLADEMGGCRQDGAAGSAALRAADARGTLAVLPGSRMGEIEKHLPVLMEVVKALKEENPALAVVVPAANERAYREICAQAGRVSGGWRGGDGIQVVRGGARELLRRADAAVVASGTATLEAALAGCPTVLVYKVSWLFALVMRRLIKGVKHVGLANIIAEKADVEPPMPELLQEDFTAANVLRELRPYLVDRAANLAARRRLGVTMKLLDSGGDAVSRIVSALEP